MAGMLVVCPGHHLPKGLVPDSTASLGRRDPQAEEFDFFVKAGRSGAHHPDRLAAHGQRQIPRYVRQPSSPPLLRIAQAAPISQG